MDKLKARDLLDIAMSVMVEPLASDPAKMHEFIAKTLYSPLDGTEEAVEEEQQSIMEQFGGLEAIKRQQERQRARKLARQAAEADTTTP